MKTRILSILFFIGPLLFIGCKSDNNDSVTSESQAAKDEDLKSMKGWELYSWEKPDGWCYSLVMGTNRVKTFEEISTPAMTLTDLAMLKNKLNQLAEKEQVVWTTSFIPGTKYPPDLIVTEVETYCKACNLDLIILRS